MLFFSSIKCDLLHFVHWLRDFCPEVIDNSIQLVKSKLLQKKKGYIILKMHLPPFPSKNEVHSRMSIMNTDPIQQQILF